MVLLLSLLAAPAPAAAPAPPEPYTTAVRLVERLFLEPERVDDVAMLRAAARGLESDLHWLVVRTFDRSVELTYGDGTPIGRIDVSSIEDLPRALAELERVVVASGYDLDGVDVRLSVLIGMSEALDRYSRILADEKLDRFNVRLTGTLVGIGATFALRDDRMWVDSVSPDGPAALGDLRVGDEILRIDGRSTVSMPLSEATRRIRGEESTQVSLLIRRDGEERSLALTRAEVVVPNVTHRSLGDGVGYVYIDHVSQRTVENLEKALADLKAAGALEKGLVIDLRGNTGGSMKESARAADLFLTEGLLLRTVGRDGGRVQNLQAEMTAVPDGTEPALPLVLVVDERTASGAEILAGALVELDRAAMVGSRTYGKGTVQKIYNLEDDVRFKLTVARYLLANDRSIHEDGLIPDVVIGRVALDTFGVRYTGWDEGFARTPWDRILPEVDEGSGWRGESPPAQDLAVELGRRAVLATTGTSRGPIRDALQAEAARVRVDQERHLAEALAARGIDWSAAEEDGDFVDARVEIESERGEGDTWRLVTRVTNLGTEPLHRALVQLDSRSAPWWDDVVVPVGLIPPGQTVAGEVRVPLAPGIDAREDAVDVRLRSDRRPPLLVGEQVLESRSGAVPTVRVRASLGPPGEELGPNGWPVRKVDVVLHDLARSALQGVEVHFGYPGTDSVELLDFGARLRSVPGRGEATVSLALEVGPDAPPLLPLELMVESDRYRTLADWPLALPLDGSPVTLEAPTIDPKPPGRSAPVGPLQVPITVADDRKLDHVVVYANGQKVAWRPGDGGALSLTATVEVLPGDNRITVLAEDDQGLSVRRTFGVRGDTAHAAVDASE